MVIWEPEDGYPVKVSLYFFDQTPDLPVAINDLDTLKDYYRGQVLQGNGGIMKVAGFSLQNIEILETLFKFPLASGEGLSYVGAYTIPFRFFSFVIKIEASEFENFGEREKAIARELLAIGKLKTEANGEISGWLADPYDSSVERGYRMNQSEKPIHDLKYPDHPLTRVRWAMREIKSSMKFFPRLEQAAPFRPH